MVCDTPGFDNNTERKSFDFVRSKMAVRDIIEDYVKFRLSVAGHMYRNGPADDPTDAMRTMRLIAQQFEASYINAEQIDMTQDIDVTAPDAELQAAVDTIFDELFSTGINWGRIVGSVVLTSKLSLKAIAANRTRSADVFVTRATSHLQSTRFSNWINAHDGWEGFVRHFSRQGNGRRHEEEFSWSRAATAGIVTLAGAAAAINFFMQKS